MRNILIAVGITSISLALFCSTITVVPELQQQVGLATISFGGAGLLALAVAIYLRK